jgi:hypothetical protein
MTTGWHQKPYGEAIMSLPETPHNRLRDLPSDEIKRVLLDKQELPERRMGAVTAIAYSQAPAQQRATVLLDCLLSEDDRLVRLLIARSLCAVDDPRVRDALWSLTQDTDIEMQEKALLSLARLKDHRILDHCVNLVSHGRSRERVGAIVALSFLGTAEAVAFLENLWKLEASRNDKLFLGKILASHGSSLSEELLESELHVKPDVDLAAALARLGNKFGAVTLQEILLEACGSTEQQYGIRIAHYLGIDPVNDLHWKEGLVEKLKKMEGG